jgi:hypothetical protein
MRKARWLAVILPIAVFSLSVDAQFGGVVFCSNCSDEGTTVAMKATQAMQYLKEAQTALRAIQMAQMMVREGVSLAKHPSTNIAADLSTLSTILVQSQGLAGTLAQMDAQFRQMYGIYNGPDAAISYALEHGRNYSTAIKGYTGEYLKAVSARTEEIEREKAAKGLVGAEADERINKRLRQAKQPWQPEALWEEHRRQAEQYGNDPAKVAEAARQRCSLVVSEKQRDLRAERAIDFARERLLEANAVVDRYELMRDALRYGLGHLRLQDVERAFERRLAQREREFIRVGHYRTHAPGERYTTNQMRSLELDTIALALKGKGTAEPIAPKLTRDQFRADYKARIVDGKEIELNDQQLWMAWNVLTCRDQVMIVRGAAGVGKSTAMKPIGEVAAQHHWFRSSGYEVLGLAATGSAANNLAELGIHAATLQSHLILKVPPDAPKACTSSMKEAWSELASSINSSARCGRKIA